MNDSDTNSRDLFVQKTSPQRKLAYPAHLPQSARWPWVWTTLKHHLLLKPSCTLAEWLKRYDHALVVAAKKKHPQRKQPRDYPRKAHTRRQKSTKFMKALRTKNDSEPPSSVPK